MYTCTQIHTNTYMYTNRHVYVNKKYKRRKNTGLEEAQILLLIKASPPASLLTNFTRTNVLVLIFKVRYMLLFKE